MKLFPRTSFDTPCRIEIEHSDRALCAHVKLAGGIAINPGDQVRVHGEPIRVGFGESAVFNRMATVERANPLERLWIKIRGHFEMSELYEVSFISRRNA